jgi:dTDP-4-dehydrorhamnose 3,5-epimerase
MIFKETKLKGAYLIQIEKHEDERGFFARAWCKKEFEEHGLNPHPVQANIASSQNKGTLRGLHYQIAPHEEVKLADNGKMLYVPTNFAHGYQTLTNNAEVFYLVSQFYSPESERGVRWNDPSFSIDWPEIHNLVISEKDMKWPDYLP